MKASRHFAYARAVREVCDRWVADRAVEGPVVTGPLDRRPDDTMVGYCGPVYSVDSKGVYRVVPR